MTQGLPPFVTSKMSSSLPHRQEAMQEADRQEAICTPFQLPHRDFLYEAHTDSVYAMQLNGKWLVSGGKDKTIRVWDLESGRLRGEPLAGHSGSVLCVQFDPSADEDVVFSGSTDTSVMVWQFSTGRRLEWIASAHDDSVLDLRFDRKYLYTSSRDTTIKIWSRRELSPLDAEYPRIKSGPDTSAAAYIVDISSMEPSLIEAGLADGSFELLKQYACIATLRAHNASVNAIHNHEDTLVSGSGDGSVKVWSIATGQRVRELEGHQKGIACIHSDGKHAVSGGSDNTVRIHDIGTGAELAVLLGHANLVRAVQADFSGILRHIGRQAVQAGRNSSDVTGESKAAERNRNPQSPLPSGVEGATSSNMQTEAQLVPRGNGGQWDRIVSGSYDETVIVWKRNTGGDWSVEHTLRLKDVANAANGQTNREMKASSIGNDEQEDLLLHRVFRVGFDTGRILCSSQDSQIHGWNFGDDTS